VVFGSIPQGYRDLVLVIAGTLTSVQGLRLRYNGDTVDTGGAYGRVFMKGDGSTTGSLATTNNRALEIGTVQTIGYAQIMDYSATDKHKTVLLRMGASNSEVLAGASRWANTAAINNIEVVSDDGVTMNTGLTLTLYGVIA
jgi:hypothetical protein